jgi:hypothetical protein
MRNTQQTIVLVGILLIVLMGLYPPWIYVDDSKVAHPMGYAPIWKPPVKSQHDSVDLFGIKLQLKVETQTANTIDLSRLLIQIAILSAVTCGAVVLLKRARA